MNVAGRKAAEKLAQKLALRLVPGLGWALLAYDVYDLIRNGLSPPANLHHDNPPCANDGGFKSLAAISANSHTATPLCTSGGALWVGGTTDEVTTTLAQPNVRISHIHTGGANRHWFRADYGPYANGTIVKYGTWPVPVRQPALKPWQVPGYEPWFDPSLPPQFQPRAKRPPARPAPYRPPAKPPRVDPTVLPYPHYPRAVPLNPGRLRRDERERRRRVREIQRRRIPKPRRRPPLIDPLPFPRIPAPQPITDPIPWPGNPSPGVSPAPQPGTLPAPAPPHGPQSPPTGWQLVVDPATANTRLRPRPKKDEPPTPPRSRGEKEKKAGMSAMGFGWAMALFNFTTEVRDWVDAVYKALPCDVRSRTHNTAAKKMEAIYRHFEKLDPAAVITELFLNQVEDAVIGRTSGFINKAFGSGESWSNYYRAFQAGNELIPGVGKVTNRALDDFAKSLSLPRVRCGRKG